MEIAGYSYSFGGMVERVKVDHARVIQFYREMGIKTIELFDMWIEDDSEVPAIIDALGEAEMNVCTCDVECDVVSRDANVRKAGTEKFHQRLAVANKLGSPQVLILPGLPAWEKVLGQPEKEGDVSIEECQEWLNTAIEQSLPVAKELGIMLTIANLGFCADIYGKSDYIVETCEAFEPDVKTVYDVGNFVMANEDSVEALDKVFPYTAHVHFKDWEIVPNEQPAAWPGIDGRLFLGKPLGEGIVKLPQVVARLKELNYDGTISPEYEGPDDPWKAIEQGIAYLRTLL